MTSTWRMPLVAGDTTSPRSRTPRNQSPTPTLASRARPDPTRTCRTRTFTTESRPEEELQEAVQVEVEVGAPETTGSSRPTPRGSSPGSWGPPWSRWPAPCPASSRTRRSGCALRRTGSRVTSTWRASKGGIPRHQLNTVCYRKPRWSASCSRSSLSVSAGFKFDFCNPPCPLCPPRPQGQGLSSCQGGGWDRGGVSCPDAALVGLFLRVFVSVPVPAGLLMFTNKACVPLVPPLSHSPNRDGLGWPGSPVGCGPLMKSPSLRGRRVGRGPASCSWIFTKGGGCGALDASPLCSRASPPGPLPVGSGHLRAHRSLGNKPESDKTRVGAV